MLAVGVIKAACALAGASLALGLLLGDRASRRTDLLSGGLGVLWAGLASLDDEGGLPVAARVLDLHR
jgi:hypothetical protein